MKVVRKAFCGPLSVEHSLETDCMIVKCLETNTIIHITYTEMMEMRPPPPRGLTGGWIPWFRSYYPLRCYAARLPFRKRPKPEFRY